MEEKKVYIICGEDEYIRQKALRALIGGLSLMMPELNHSVFEGRTKLMDIITACETLPLMDEKRLVHVKNHEMFSAKTEDTKPLEDYIGRIPSTTVLLFDQTGKIDKRRKLYKLIEKQGVVRECGKLSQNEIIGIVSEEAANRGITLSKGTALALVAQSGSDMLTLTAELEKLASLKPGGTIAKEDIEKYASKSLEYDVFSLHRLFMQNKAADALAVLTQVLEVEKSPFGVIGLIASKFRLMLKARALIEAGYPANEVLKNMGGNPYAAKEALQDAKNMNSGVIRDALKSLAELDYCLKSGQGNKFMTETVLLKMYNPKGGNAN
jgi:DNA polymerase-3 subunit delta